MFPDEKDIFALDRALRDADRKLSDSIVTRAFLFKFLQAARELNRALELHPTPTSLEVCGRIASANEDLVKTIKELITENKQLKDELLQGSNYVNQNPSSK